MNAEGRERFFRAIAERIDSERVEEVHVFPAIRQGGRESGVAVLTVRPLPPESESAGEIEEIADSADGADLAAVAGTEDGEGLGDAEAADDIDGVLDAASEPIESPHPPQPPRRFTVLRAHYRLQLKGPDRGKWEVGVVEEADAPSATVDEVVRGVHERAGGWSVEGPERLTGDEFRAALAEEPWSAAR